MSERQSSGLVKKGKFVRRLLEIMGDGTERTAKQIWIAGAGGIGPNEDYVKTNLDKLVASGEIILQGDAYSLPADSEWHLAVYVGAVSPELEEVAETPASLTVTPAKSELTQAGKIERNYQFETFVGICFMQDVPTWEVAANFYASLHGVTYSIVKFDGKIAGERVKFNF